MHKRVLYKNHVLKSIDSYGSGFGKDGKSIFYFFLLSGPSGRASSLSSTSYDESSVNLRRPSISQCSQSRIENYSPCIKRKDITKLQSGDQSPFHVTKQTNAS